MMDNVSILKMASALARHAADRHKILSENIANADTSGYKAKDLEPFADAYSRFSKQGENKDNINAFPKFGDWRVETVNMSGADSPNGNSVSIEDQMMRSIAAQQDHQAATLIYKKAIDIMRISLGRGA